MFLCVSLLSNVLFIYVSYLRICFVTGQQTVLFKFSYMLYMQVCVCVCVYVNVFYGLCMWFDDLVK